VINEEIRLPGMNADPESLVFIGFGNGASMAN